MDDYSVDCSYANLFHNAWSRRELQVLLYNKTAGLDRIIIICMALMNNAVMNMHVDVLSILEAFFIMHHLSSALTWPIINRCCNWHQLNGSFCMPTVYTGLLFFLLHLVLYIPVSLSIAFMKYQSICCTFQRLPVVTVLKLPLHKLFNTDNGDEWSYTLSGINW